MLLNYQDRTAVSVSSDQFVSIDVVLSEGLCELLLVGLCWYISSCQAVIIQAISVNWRHKLFWH